MMETKKVNSRPGTLTKQDLIKTTIVTVGIAVGEAVCEALKPGGSGTPDLKRVMITAAIGALMTIGQRLLSNSEGKIAREPKK